MSDPEGRLGRIEAVLSPVVQEHGLSLVDAEWRREGRRWVLRLFVDKPGGVTIADCQRLSHEAGDMLDVSGLLEEAYDLEVSSPGLDRELRKDREFAWAIGKELRCWVREPVGGRTEFCGRLVAVTAGEVIVEDAQGETSMLPRHLVTKARLVPVSAGRRAQQGR
ncbi:MAG: ribosome maturation factor RimP [Candidatus Rokubacteria bacterium]|nr:ribosome maturation factor RimP [Candidatus Rokubacteria bacterium]MBI3104774.1 ribosome maturation factor RimP [Candidatus Rokubacteria bacterium]